MSYVTFRLDSTVVHNAISTPDLDDNIKDVEDPPDLPIVTDRLNLGVTT
jgi:hypothetical protein